MNREKKTVSIIIPVPPGDECGKSLESVKIQNYPRELLQILVAEGRHRSIQRNRAIERVKGEIIWFMDNDVIIKDPEYLNKCLRHYADPNVASVGGPSLTNPEDSFFQHSIGQVLASFFATQSIRARYTPIGRARETTEKELILCSQTFRASSVGKGFDERLHSGNEENHLMNRIQKAGGKMIYDPELHIFRSQRKNLKEFILQIGKYGKSRMEHFLIKPSAFEILFLAPLCFLIYLLSLPIVFFLDIPVSYKQIYAAPILAYAFLSLLSAAAAVVRSKNIFMLFSAFLLYPVLHISYALGSIFGFYRHFVPEVRSIPDVLVREEKL